LQPRNKRCIFVISKKEQIINNLKSPERAKIMTNVEIYLKSAIENLEAGKLTLSEKVFINSIKDYSKKELKTLSSSDFKLLRSISNK
jgi:hypothetical protein